MSARDLLAIDRKVIETRCPVPFGLFKGRTQVSVLNSFASTCIRSYLQHKGFWRLYISKTLEAKSVSMIRAYKSGSRYTYIGQWIQSLSETSFDCQLCKSHRMCRYAYCISSESFSDNYVSRLTGIRGKLAACQKFLVMLTICPMLPITVEFTVKKATLHPSTFETCATHRTSHSSLF